MPKLCLCLTGRTIAKNLELIERYRAYIDVAELRVDCLADDELDSVRRFPALAGLPVILTVRRVRDGGCFKSGEGSRLVLLSKALAFAEPDKRHNFAYVDIEEDLDVPSLEEVARAFGTRVIRSFHLFNGFDFEHENLEERLRSLYHVGDEIVKAAIMPRDLDDVTKLIVCAKTLRDKDKIIIAMGDLGHCTRILAAKLGSYLTYASLKNEEGLPEAGPGQIGVLELVNEFHFKKLTSDTAVYGITGYPLKTTASPAFHNGAIGREGLDAVYIRFPSPTIESFLRLADELSLAGASVTVPHKETVMKYLTHSSKEVVNIGACNTIIRLPKNEGGGWAGFNTDVLGFRDSLLALFEKSKIEKSKIKRPRGCHCAIAGAGGAAKAVAAALASLKAKFLILNRDIQKAERLAVKYGALYGSLNDVSRMKKYNDVIVQTTSLGNENSPDKDPLGLYHFTGDEIVIDIIYKPEKTIFLRRALAAGCLAINGADMLSRQAEYQYKLFFGHDAPPALLLQ